MLHNVGATKQKCDILTVFRLCVSFQQSHEI